MIFGFAQAATRPPADVSVVIPVYNHERFVAAAIASALSQTTPPREVICIDDGSTDGSARVVSGIAASEPRVRFWSRPNQGAHATLNEGIRAATSANVAILNSDDLFDPGRLETCLAVLEEDPAVGVVATGIRFIDGDGAPRENAWYEKARTFHGKSADLGLSLVNGNFLMTTSNIVARKAVLAEAGPFDSLRYAHDLDFFLRLLVRLKKITVLGHPLLRYRIHGSNTIAEAHAQVRVRVEWALAVAFFAARMAPQRPPGYLSRMLNIAASHRLLPMMTLALLYASDPRFATPGTCLADPSLRSALLDLAQ
jgi:glycosyltransferase involved in cell wall biosynthesis